MQNFNSVRIKIRDIGPGNENLMLTGIIIRKQDLRTVRIKKGTRLLCGYQIPIST